MCVLLAWNTYLDVASGKHSPAVCHCISSVMSISSAKGNKKFSYSIDISLWYGINIIRGGGQCDGVSFLSSRDDCTESISGFALLCHLWVMQSFLTQENEVCCPSCHQKPHIYEHIQSRIC